MATEVKLPEIGEGIESGDVLEVLVSEGDVISEGQDVVELETDKATVPVPSSAAGKVLKIHVSAGDTVPIGGVLLEVEAAEEAAGEEEAPQPSADAAAEKQESAKKAEGKKAKADEEEAEESAAAEADEEPAAEEEEVKDEEPQKEAPSQPQRSKTPQPAHTQSRPADQTPAKTSAKEPAAGRSSAAPNAAAGAADEAIPAGPAIRRFAREVGVDLSQVQGTGEGGRITRDDVLEVVRQMSQAVRGGNNRVADKLSPAAPPATSGAAPGASAASEEDEGGAVRVERMSKIRKTIARQMHISWTTVPRVTNFDDADITELERLRQTSKEDYAAQGIKLTTMPFLIKAIATALRHHPTVNAVIDEENEQIVYKDYVNIGVAVDTDRGLVVPVMRGADRLGIPDIARHLAEMAAKVRSGQFAVNELRGGTFTISNLGTIGGQYSTPIVNVPEVAILLVGRSRKLPVVMPDDSIAPRLMMPLSLSYDHRLVDGATAQRFLNDVIGYLEAPSRLLLAL